MNKILWGIVTLWNTQFQTINIYNSLLFFLELFVLLDNNLFDIFENCPYTLHVILFF